MFLLFIKNFLMFFIRHVHFRSNCYCSTGSVRLFCQGDIFTFERRMETMKQSMRNVSDALRQSYLKKKTVKVTIRYCLGVLQNANLSSLTAHTTSRREPTLKSRSYTSLHVWHSVIQKLVIQREHQNDNFMQENEKMLVSTISINVL